jgi:UDP-N-acetylglucosamine 1-carboxyvinyltransferase
MLVTGGNSLEGQVRVSGGKNTAVAVIPATLLCDEPCTIENLPDIEDVHALADILGSRFSLENTELVDINRMRR